MDSAIVAFLDCVSSFIGWLIEHLSSHLVNGSRETISIATTCIWWKERCLPGGMRAPPIDAHGPFPFLDQQLACTFYGQGYLFSNHRHWVGTSRGKLVALGSFEASQEGGFVAWRFRRAGPLDCFIGFFYICIAGSRVGPLLAGDGTSPKPRATETTGNAGNVSNISPLPPT